MPFSTSARTLILGIDQAGRIVEHDRSAPDVLAAPGGCLLGSHLADLAVGPASAGSPMADLLEAAHCRREAVTVLSIRTQHRSTADVVASVQPMDSHVENLAALVVLHMPPPIDDQFLDPALMRHALLDDTFREIGATLDLDQLARSLLRVVVPRFCNTAGLLVLDSLVAADEPAEGGTDGSAVLRRLAFATDDSDPRWEAAMPVGEVVRHAPGSPHARCLETGKPVREEKVTALHAGAIGHSGMHGPVHGLLPGSSQLLLPLRTKDSTLGFIACLRRPGVRPFDDYDTEIGEQFASRAAIFVDNARRYNRERATALTLQRSLLPTGLSAPSSVEVSHRYLPGGQLIEVGGDWYESMALPGARVALVVGDVAGHGVRAAVTMGRLRTAVQTLAMLEMNPAESLHQLDELMQTIGDQEPHFATCAYATYDAVSGTCEIASAGHLPPLLVHPDGTSEFLDLPSSPPLGVGQNLITTRTFQVDDGSLLVLYTDGLVESRERDIDEGLARLRTVLGPSAASRTVEDLCGTILASAYDDHQRDDIALLIARLSRIDAAQQACWALPREPASAGRARALVGELLGRWDLPSLVPTTQLLVSELVTNAIRYTRGPVTLRMIREGALVCEVLDRSPALPRLRHADHDDECGRGLQIVSQLSDRWGARRTPEGKIVWCEQQFPRTG